MSNKIIEHSGTIKEKDGNKLLISIIPESSCVSCSVKGSCSTASNEEKIVEIFDATSNYQIGEQVEVFYSQELGFQALFLGYIFPFLLLMFALIATFSLTNSEGLAGIISLVSLFPYYLLLYFFRSKLKKKFSFHLKQKNKIQDIDFFKQIKL